MKSGMARTEENTITAPKKAAQYGYCTMTSLPCGNGVKKKTKSKGDPCGTANTITTKGFGLLCKCGLTLLKMVYVMGSNDSMTMLPITMTAMISGLTKVHRTVQR